ncbi:hypothetical protein MBLNU230_g0117t1 [Neophaeotheca triangularis]
MPATIGVALIGSGIFVKEQHYPAVQASDALSLKAIYSRSLKSAQSVSPDDDDQDDVALYSDDSDQNYADLLQRDDVHAVIIALPILVQPAFVKQALSAGKHVLAEKPIAKDVATARELIAWYHGNTDTTKVYFGVAEQFRYLNAFVAGAKQVRDFGNVVGLRLRMQTLLTGGKYFETPWRKKPEYQGGFLLDGGVHFIAGMRLLLGREARVQRVSAFTAQLQPHLPPVDTVDATFRLANGSCGVFSVSFGTTFTGSEWSVACEGGSVRVEGKNVVIKRKGEDEVTEEYPDELGGVKQEVFAWANGLVNGKQEAQQKPEEALADLEILEAMIQSGERDGAPIELKHQL